MGQASLLTIARHGPVCLVWLVILCAGRAQLLAAETGHPPNNVVQTLTADEPVPDSSAVQHMIKELESVRDYERLYWLLHAIERQVPPVRAELLKQLDAHVQQLIEAELNARTATLAASLQAALAADGGQQAKDVKVKVELAAANPATSSASDQQQAARQPFRLVPERSYREVQQAIEQATFSEDHEAGLEEFRAVHDMILGVEDPDQRQALRRLYHERSMKTVQERMSAEETDFPQPSDEAVSTDEE